MGARRETGGWWRRAATLVAVALGLCGCVERRLEREFTRVDTGILASPALHVVLCGTGIGLPEPPRQGSCVAIVAGGLFFLVDAGPGSWRVVDLANLPTAHLDAVFLTKLLEDDAGDLGEAVTRSWLAGRERALPIYGPRGTERLVRAVADASDLDAMTRLARHDPALLRPGGARVEAREFGVGGEDGAEVVFERQGVRVTAFSVTDAGNPPSVGYRVDYGGRAVVIGGHARNHPNLVRWAAGADILVHEAASHAMLRRGIDVMARVGNTRMAQLTADMLKTHATPVEAATAARAAGVGLLVLTHLAPSPDDWFLRHVFLRGVRDVFPRVVIGEDGMRFRLDPR